MTLLDAYGKMLKASGVAGERVDSRLDRLFSSLGASFDAAVDREEEEAATDLAFSLRQGRSLTDRLSGKPCSVIDAGQRVPIVELAPDHVRTSRGWLMPLGRTIVRLDEAGAAPAVSEQRLVERLRAAARSADSIEVRTSGTSLEGRIVGCGPDHLGIQGGEGETFVPLDLVQALRLSRAG